MQKLLRAFKPKKEPQPPADVQSAPTASYPLGSAENSVNSSAFHGEGERETSSTTSAQFKLHTPPAAVGMKHVHCAGCGHMSVAPIGGTSAYCTGCGALLAISGVPPLQVMCGSCDSVNLAPAGSDRIRCGSCQSVLQVGASQEDLERDQVEAALAESRLDADTRLALHRSVHEY
eukprot:TRINITY_DN36659_c0_g1_i1.p1 TRINITY_DN36659_c0_g1~~TRINITY_DN36659_c0_g1_i1.p1  ORF type:complete len:175 (+),score=23.69 TRINITY_DN36659_c0_g1_i1:104-628(+)